MKIELFAQQILSNPLFSSQIPVQLQLGIPEIYEDRGLLILHYRLHRQEYLDGVVRLFPAACTLKLAYPTGRILSFTDCCLPPQQVPVCQIPGEELLKRGSVLLRALYESADRILCQWEMGELSHDALAAYGIQYQNTIRELRLQPLYGG